MPGFTTHYLFGVKNLQQLKKSASCPILFESIEHYKTVFQLGLQGPDLFFYYFVSQMKKIKLGSMTHKTLTGDFLQCLVQAPELFSAEKERMIARAYAAGFIGHYVLDTEVHPYVYFMTGYGDALKQKGYADHVTIESDIDTCLLMRYAKKLPSEFPHWKTIAFNSHTRSVVTDVLHHVYHTVYPHPSQSPAFFSRAICSMQMATRLTYNPNNYKRRALGRIEQIVLGKLAISPVIPTDAITYEDPLNLQHKKWHNPWNPDDVSALSVPQLIKKASARYQEVFRQLDKLYQAGKIEGAYDTALNELSQMLGQKSYHSGLDWILGE